MTMTMMMDVVETMPLDFLPHLGQHGLLWNKDHGLIAVAGSDVVVVCRPQEHGLAGKMQGIGLVSWREGVPCLGSSPDDFVVYRDMLGVMHVDAPDGADGDKKKASQTKLSSDVGRGRRWQAFMGMMGVVSSFQEDVPVDASVMGCNMFDDVYWNLDLPRIVSMAWSPPMCSDRGDSMLGVVFDDSTVMLFSSGSKMSPLWVPDVRIRYHFDGSCSEIENGGCSSSGEFVKNVVASSFTCMSWSDAMSQCNGMERKVFSVFGLVSQTGVVTLYRVLHVSVPLEGNSCIEERVQCIGRLEVVDERVSHVKMMVVPGNRGEELVVVCGCTSGAVAVWSVPSSQVYSMEPCEWSSCSDLVSVTGVPPVMILAQDDLMVSNIDCCITKDEKLLVVVGKSMGVVRLFLSSDVTEAGVLASLEKGLEISVPQTMDSHSISGVVCLMGGSLVVASSRLGNIMTLKVPLDGESRQSVLGAKPVHSSKNAADKGYGCYGLAASPGGYFVAIARQALEPDIEQKKQLQTHQLLTQGYLHIQSIVGHDAEIPDVLLAVRQHVDSWVSSDMRGAALWDASRMFLMAVSALDKKQVSNLLVDIQARAGVGGIKNGAPSTYEATKETPRYAAAMIHLLYAFPQSYDGVLALSDWELIALKTHLESIIHSQGMDTLSRVLAIDCFACQNVSHPWLFTNNEWKAVKTMYAQLGFEPQDPETLQARPLSLDGAKGMTAPIQKGSVLTATIKYEGESCTLERCPMTLMANLDGGMWQCRTCSRHFSTPPQPAQHSRLGPFSPFTCPLCAGCVGQSTPQWLLKP